MCELSLAAISKKDNRSLSHSQVVEYQQLSFRGSCNNKNINMNISCYEILFNPV